MSGLTENLEVTIDKESFLEIPKDFIVDEFIIVSEDYSRDIFKFRHQPSYSGERIFSFVDNLKIIDKDGNIIINSN